MSKPKQTVYFASYAFCADGEDKVQGTLLADENRGLLIKELIEDFATRFLKEDFKLSSSLVSGFRYQHDLGCRITGAHPSDGHEIALSFDFSEETGDIKKTNFDLWSAFHWFALHTTNTELSQEWREKAAKTMNVSVGVYHLN